MESAYFTSKLKKRLGILPNVFVLIFIVLSIFITILAYFYGLNNSFANADSSNLDVIKQNNIKLLAAPANIENEENSEDNTEGLNINIFQERIDQEVQKSSDKITLGGEKYFLSEGCDDIKNRSDCKLFKLKKDGDYIVIQDNFNLIISDRYTYYDSISFDKKQKDYLKFIELNLDLKGFTQNSFNYDLANKDVVFINSSL